MRQIVIMFIACLVPTWGFADDLKSEIARCAVLTGDLERLQCLDQLAKRHQLDGPQESSNRIEGVGKWQISDKTNPIDDSRTVSLILWADSGVSRWGKPIGLVLRCQSNKTELYINWGSYLGREADVLTRVGSENAVTRRWSLSSDSQATFYPSSPINFIKQLTQSNRFVTQVTPYNESPVTAIFNTEGLENAIKPLRETCSW